MEDSRVSVAVLTEKIRAIEALIPDLITRDEFTPVRLLVYGGTGMALTAVAGAVLALAIKG